MSKQHRVKCWPEYFEPLARGEKTAELRLDDRGYAVGDTFGACEWEPMTGQYTGRESWHMIAHITRGGPWLADGYAMLSLRPVAGPDEALRAQLSAELAASRAEAGRLREATLWTAAALQAVCNQPRVITEAGRITIEGEGRAVSEILDDVADALAPAPNAERGAAMLDVVKAARRWNNGGMDAIALSDALDDAFSRLDDAE